MSDDILKEGSEEENKPSNQSDDDFGLPDLEFDELQELDMDFVDGNSLNEDSLTDGGTVEETPVTEFDMSLLEDSSDASTDSTDSTPDLDPPTGTILEEGIDEVEDVLDSAQLISDRLGDDTESVSVSSPSSVNYDDLIGGETEETQSSEPADDLFGEPSSSDEDLDDLFAGIDSPDDLAALGYADEDESPAPAQSEASDSLLLSDDSSTSESSGESLFEPEENLMAADEEPDSIFGSDSLTLEEKDESSFEAAPDNALPPNYKSYNYEESKGGFVKYIVIGVVVIACAAILLLVFGGDDEKEKAVAKKEHKVTKKVPKKKKPAKTTVDSAEAAAEKEAMARKKAEEEAMKMQMEAEKANAKPVKAEPAVASGADPGEITFVESRTSLSYIIIGSFVDEDLAMDYANELVKEGNGVKIIKPYGKSKRYRVSIADYESYGDAAGQIDSFKGQYGDQVWALKY